MRVNPNTTSDMLSLLSQTQQAENTYLQQVSSGKRVNIPSDDPAAAAANVTQTARSAADDEYIQSNSSIEQSLSLADSTLSSVVTSLTRAITLGVNGGNGTLSTSDMDALASEVDGIKTQVMGLANTTFNGQYLFAGTNTQVTPYVADSTQSSGVRYDGNDQQNTAQAGAGLTVSINQPGSSIFNQTGSDVFSALQSLSTALSNHDASAVETATTSVRTALNAVTSARVFYGTTTNQLEAQDTYLNQEKVDIASYQNDLVGADLTTAVTNLSQAQLAHQATLQAMARTANMTLLNYLPAAT